MQIEKVDDYESKRETNLKLRANLLSIRAYEAADVVQQFGSAVVQGKRLISAGDVNMMVHRLKYYGDWLMRIANGEDVEEDHLREMEETIASIRLPKKNKYKRGIIEVIYVGETDTGAATRHKLHEIKSDDLHQGDPIKINFTVGGKYGSRLPKRK